MSKIGSSGRHLIFVKKHGKNRMNSIHMWLRYHNGSANKCELCQSTASKKSGVYEWALKHGCSYDYKTENFIQLCRSCHRKYDDYQPVNRVAVYQTSKNGKIIKKHSSIKAAAKETGIIRTGILNNLAGRAKSAGGFVWRY